MHILFVSDVARNFSVGGFEPLGIMYLAAPLWAAGHTVSICDAEETEILKRLDEFRPRVVAYSATTGAHELFLGLNRKVKKWGDILSVFGGPHPTFYPKMIEEEGVDAICLGEGEDAFAEFVGKLDRGEDISTVRNFHVKEGGAIVRNELRPLVEDLDRIPFPDRELFYRAYPAARGAKMKTFLASRGCPYRCTYCFNHLYNKLYRGKGRIVRSRSPGNVIEEVRMVKERYPLEFVVFHDSSFFLHADWLRDFSAQFRREIGLPFNCNIRPEMITDETARYLKEGGCFSVAWAIEAGNDRIRNRVLGRGMSRETILDASRLLRRHGINFLTQNMLGIPGETLAECMETLDLNIQCTPQYAWASLLSPYPGTDIYAMSQEAGLIPPEGISFDETYHVHSPLRLPDKKRIENLQKLFSITVEFPVLRPLTRLLVGLPLSPFYNLIRRLHKGFCLRYRIFYYRISMREYVSLAWRFLTSKAG
ncbi:MAG: radical SAM protein [Chlamydiota bacterium]